MRSGIVRAASYGLAVVVMVVSMAGVLHAAFQVAAPEIDASSIATGLGVLTAGVLIVRSRRRFK